MVDAGFREELLEVWDRGEEDTHTLIGLVVEVLGGAGGCHEGLCPVLPHSGSVWLLLPVSTLLPLSLRKIRKEAEG